MLASSAALLIPLGLALVIAAGARLALGPERGPRFVGLAVPVAFLIAWGVIVRPGWLAFDPIGRIGHIVFGGLLIGALLDIIAPPRLVAVATACVYLLVCAWTEVHGGFAIAGGTASLLTFIVVAVVAVGLLWRIDVLRAAEQPHVPAGSAALVQVVMVALSLAAVGTAAEDVPLRIGALIMAAALFGYLFVAWEREPTIPNVVVLSVTGAFVALAWALCERTPAAIAGVALTGLILFADGTARRVPLPGAGISRMLYPLVLVGMSALPLILATIATVALLRVP